MNSWSIESLDERASMTHFEINFAPNVELVSSVRRFAATLYSRLLGAEAADMVALATHELLENAVRYATSDVTYVRVELVRAEGAVEVTITTRNRAKPADVAALRDVVEQLAKTEDPFVYYQQRMRETAHRREGSGLGLARVRAEADMSVSCDVKGEFLIVAGRATFPNR